MPQNPEKYFYINRVGLVRNSWAHKKFEEDAERHHMEDQPGKLVALRLTEFYELMERLGGAYTVPGASIYEFLLERLAGGALPAETNGAAAMNGTTATSTTRVRPGRRRSSQGAEEEGEQSSPPADQQSDPDAALDESIDYWTNL